VKIVLIGNPEIYYLLYNLDEEYRELFKVKADFDHRIERTEESVDHYAAFVATKVKEEALMPFAREGVARVSISAQGWRRTRRNSPRIQRHLQSPEGGELLASREGARW